MSLPIMLVKFIHLTVAVGTSILFILENYFILWIYHRLPNRQPLDIESFSVLSIINKASTNSNELVFVWTSVFIYPGYIPRSEKLGHMVSA